MSKTKKRSTLFWVFFALLCAVSLALLELNKNSLAAWGVTIALLIGYAFLRKKLRGKHFYLRLIAFLALAALLLSILLHVGRPYRFRPAVEKSGGMTNVVELHDGKVQGVTQFVTTRFGNVLGSNGSVIPIFREQIKNGGPITVTDPEMVRFFMLIPEACKLVLEAGTMGKGGEIYVFDMGKPVKIVSLAKRMIKLSGAKNIDIVFTGLRDGEKLYEEVLATAENTLPTDHPKILRAKVREYDYDTAVENEERLLKTSYSFDDMAIVKIMKEIVPEFKSNNSKYEVLDK